MTERDKVIWALQCCTSAGTENINGCRCCDYKRSANCMYQLMKDAERILKRERHRVLSLEEIIKNKDELVTEFRYGIPITKTSLEDRCRWLGQGREYGVTWRCWNEMPEENEIANTEWNSEEALNEERAADD